MDFLRNNSFNATEHTTGSLQFGHLIMLLTLCVFVGIAFAEHLAILLLTYLNKTLRQKPYIVAILLLSSSDILLSLALFLVSLINLVPLRQTWVCGLAYFLIQVGLVTSLVHTLIICTERYLCMRPFPTEMLSLRKRQALTTINIGISSLMLGIPFLLSSRKATMEKCHLSYLFEENLAYAQVPIRSLTFLLWISIIIVYVITAKNFKSIVSRTVHFNPKHNIANISFPIGRAASRTTDNSQSDLDMISSMSCTTLGLNISREGEKLSLEMNRLKLLSEAKFTELVVDTDKANETTGACASTSEEAPLESESKIFKDEKDLNCPVDVHCEVKTEEITRANKRSKDSIQVDETDDFDIKYVRQEDHADKNTSEEQQRLSGRSQITRSNLAQRRQRHGHLGIVSQATKEVHTVRAFKLVSVVFIVFLITMTPQSVAGLAMMFFPVSDNIAFVCAILAASSLIINPIMYTFLLKDFREVVLRCK